MNRHDVTRELRALSLPEDQYVVVGGAVLAIHGIRETDDIDLVVSESLFTELRARGWRVKTRPSGKPGLKHGVTEAYLDVNCEPYERSTFWLLDNAQVVDGIPTIDLETLARYKTANGRAKDQVDLKLLDEQCGITVPPGISRAR